MAPGVVDPGCARSKLPLFRAESLMASDRSQRRMERLLDEADEAVAQLGLGNSSRPGAGALVFDPHNGDAALISRIIERG